MEDQTSLQTDLSKSWQLLSQGIPYRFAYEKGCFTWQKVSSKHKDNTPVLRKISIRHVLSVTHDKRKEGFTMNFIDLKPKCVWKRASQKFISSAGSCEDVIAFIASQITEVQEKPKKLLVYVNPCSGKCNGVNIHKKFVEPIFKLATVEYDTIVTTHAGHIKEHLQSVNLSGYHGVVVVGGDGTFTEAFDALIRRNAKEYGVNLLHDSKVQLTQVPIRLGIVPAGTGQGMVNGATGTCDPETAVLHIVTGYSSSLDGICAYNGDKLMAIGSLLFGYGLFGDIIKMSEENRQLGRMRYLYAMARGLVKFRTVDVELSYLKCSDIRDSATLNLNQETQNTSAEDNAKADKSYWTQADNSYKAVSGFLLNNPNIHPHSLALQLAVNSTSRIKILKELSKLRQTFEDLLTNPEYEMTESAGPSSTASARISNDRAEGSIQESDFNIPVKAVRFNLKSHTIESLAQLTPNAREVINVDGEAFTLTHPQVEIRVHDDVLQMFGVGFKELKKPEWYGKKSK